MKKSYSCFVLFLFTSVIASAASKYWVGPVNGNWSNGKYWSFTSGGAGGAGIPGTADAVIFTGNARVNVDVPPTILSLSTTFGSNSVVLFTSVPIRMYILSMLAVAPYSSLKDSTSANVPFTVVFNAATHATGSIMGDWIFEGGVPVSGYGNGASFIAPAGTVVRLDYSTYLMNSARIICKPNTAAIVSSDSTLKFGYKSFFISENNPVASIPFATWAKDSVSAISPYGGTLGAPASTILLSGKLQSVVHLGGVPVYGKVVIDLPLLSTDINLSLPNGSKVRGNLEVLNSNYHTVTLLAATSPASTVQVELGTHEAGYFSGYLFGGYLVISGSATKVALANATAAAPSTSYMLLVNKSYSQTGGNFSLQDYNGATGSSTLDIKDHFVQSGGTFYTNSTSVSPAAKFMVIMDDPTFISGPSGMFDSGRRISVSSGTIDNGQHMVTLRVNHTTYGLSTSSGANGVLLMSPLKVGRLELVKSPLTTTAPNIITVTDPSPDAVTVGTAGNSYVNGPLIRATNTIQPYSFPTGKGNSPVTGYTFNSCVVTPVSTSPSMYMAEYFNSGIGLISAAYPLEGVSHSEYWNINRLAGSDAMVKLTLHAAIPGVSFDRGLVVAKYLLGTYYKVNGEILTPGNAAAGSVQSKVLSDFGTFTFGYGKPALLALPASMVLLNASGNNNTGATAGAGNVREEKTLTATGESGPMATRIYPNPFVQSFMVDFNYAGNAGDKADVEIYDLKGSLLYTHHAVNIVAGHNIITVNPDGKIIQEGVYMAALKINGMVVKTVKLIKAK